MWPWCHHVIILLAANLQFSLADMALLHLGPIIFGGSDKVIAYLRKPWFIIIFQKLCKVPKNT